LKSAKDSPEKIIKNTMDSLTFINLEYFFLKILECVTGSCVAGTSPIVEFLEKIKPISTIISLLLLAGIIYSLIRIRQIRREEADKFGEIIVAKGTAEKKRKKWNQLVDLATSPNESDWRLAIIEADTMLDDMVDAMGYEGEGLGERLKQIERSDFNTLNQAWEAHKIRNNIAHAGSDFTLTQREVRRVIDLYKQVFDEFDFI
jgi:hypothetical protein|tara:strand:- start:538 stop:1146 length:609 start_codon:yes stop_codon:yes gene_type:complete